MRFMVTASAPISKEVLDMMKIAFACPVIEAYGLSETLGGSNLTLPNDPISGTVGGPCLTYTMKLKDLPHMDYRLTDKPFPRGEILIGGPGNFRGYFNNPEKTAEMLDQDGFVHTGDVGVLYPNGSVKILDRSKNIFKLAQGEYLAPEKLENIYI
jgi:long-chain acyl-CoA synthetase